MKTIKEQSSNTLITFILVFLTFLWVTTVVYVAASFISWEFDPSRWPAEARFGFVSVSIFFTCVILSLREEIYKSLK